MSRFFNTTGPCYPERHYMLPPEERLIGAQLHRYIRDELYWVLHAPRQTGKTTFLMSWMRELNASGKVVACRVSTEAARNLSDAERAIPTICESIRTAAEQEGLPVPTSDDVPVHMLLNNTLKNWAAQVAPKPLVVLFDESDVLEGEAMLSFLSQLRDGFTYRGVGKFPISIVLVGMRDLKDYITTIKGGAAPSPGSPFNIKEDSVMIGNFSKDSVEHLFAQRTAETGQQISREALDYVWQQSKGQPWIVNSLFKRATLRVLDDDSTETVTLEHVVQARKQMVDARETHLDALSKRLEDPRVKWVIEAVVSGEADKPLSINDDDVEYTCDLGLITYDDAKGYVISNPLYEEMLIRCLNLGYQQSTPAPDSWRWQKADGSLDMDALLREFQDFWQTNSEIWEQTTNYREAFPHLLLIAFLQRVTNGHGRVEREYAAGRGRMDIAVEFQGRWNIIEVKLQRHHRTYEWVKERGLTQIRKYRERFPKAESAYLVIFDRRPEAKELKWSEKLKWEQEGDVTVVGL